MYTFQDLYEKYQILTSDNTDANTTFGKQSINDTHRYVCSLYNWPFTEGTKTYTTTALQQSFRLPLDYRKLISVKITTGGITYTPVEIADEVLFDKLNAQGTTVSQDYPNYFHIRAGRLLMYPAISSASLTVTMEYHKLPQDMSADEYATGTISAVTNGDETVTGSGTTWTSAMVNRGILMPDGYWYKIATFTSTTSVELDRPYEGTTIAAGSSAYTISEVPLIPDGFQELLYLRPVAEYHMTKEHEEKTEYYKNRFKEVLNDLRRIHGSKTTQTVFPSRQNMEIRNANDYPLNIT